jgi:predicted nucleic acid-binding Zn ribbon protein
VDVWDEAVGNQVAAHVRPTSIADDTLHVDVDQAAWATEVSFISARVLAALEERLGQRVATFIVPRVRGGSGVE